MEMMHYMKIPNQAKPILRKRINYAVNKNNISPSASCSECYGIPEPGKSICLQYCTE